MNTKHIEKIIPLFEDKRQYLSRHCFFYSEKHLQCIWFDSRIRPKNLFTADQKEVLVESPGEWNKEAGPDFINATLKVDKDNKILKGDIEVHITPEDWIKHGHSSDPHYQNVIAHISYFEGKLPEGVLPKNTIEIALEKPLLQNKLFSFDAIDISAVPELPRAILPPCQSVLKTNPPEMAQALLNEAGKTRIAIKAERIKKLIEEAGEEQAFYEEMMVALGFKNNTQQMRKLAKLIPIKTLREESENEPDKAFAILLGVSGLLPAQAKNSFDKESRILIRNIWDWWWKKSSIWAETKMQQSEWTLYGIRPQNHPQRRLLAVAQLFITKEKPLMEKIKILFKNKQIETKGLFKEVLKLLKIKAPPYWQTHILLGSPQKNSMENLVGEGRSSAILINIIIPFLVATGYEYLLNTYYLSDVPPEDENIIIRRAAINLFGKDHNPSAIYNVALRQQGLIQIYYDFCMIDKTLCKNCPLGKVLSLE